MPSYAYDPSGRLLENRIVNEPHTLTTRPSDTSLFFIPNAAPFFTDTMVLRPSQNSNSQQLIAGKDYYFTHDFPEATREVKRHIAGGIVLADRNRTGMLYATYQTLGGDFIADDVAAVEALTRHEDSISYVTWGALVNVPAAFPPYKHPHTTQDLVGLSGLTETLALIAAAIRDKPAPEFPTGGGDSGSGLALLNEHLRASSAHTKAQVGLSKVMNFAVANNTHANEKSDQHYTTPGIVHYMIARFLEENPNVSETILRVFNNPDEANAPDIIYDSGAEPSDKSVFLVKGAGTRMNVSDTLERTREVDTGATSISLCFQVFSNSSLTENLPGAENRRYLVAFDLSRGSIFGKTLNSNHPRHDSGWFDLITKDSAGLDQIRNLSYVDIRDWESLKEDPPTDKTKAVTGEKYVTLSAVQAMMKELKAELQEGKEHIKVGDYYLTSNNFSNSQEVTNHLGYGTWERDGQGKVLTGVATSSTLGVPNFVKVIGSTSSANYTISLERKHLPRIRIPNGSYDDRAPQQLSSHAFGSHLMTNRYSDTNPEGNIFSQDPFAKNSGLQNVEVNQQADYVGYTDQLGQGISLDITPASLVIGVWKRKT